MPRTPLALRTRARPARTRRKLSRRWKTPCALWLETEPGRMSLTVTKQTMAQFAESLANQMDRPVVDQTGLTKNYDFTLEFAPESGGRGLMGIPLPTPPPGDGGTPHEAD